MFAAKFRRCVLLHVSLQYMILDERSWTVGTLEPFTGVDTSVYRQVVAADEALATSDTEKGFFTCVPSGSHKKRDS